MPAIKLSPTLMCGCEASNDWANNCGFVTSSLSKRRGFSAFCRWMEEKSGKLTELRVSCSLKFNFVCALDRSSMITSKLKVSRELSIILESIQAVTSRSRWLTDNHMLHHRLRLMRNSLHDLISWRTLVVYLSLIIVCLSRTNIDNSGETGGAKTSKPGSGEAASTHSNASQLGSRKET